MMPKLPRIDLDSNWRCQYFEHDPKLYEFMDDVSVPSLSAWVFDKRRAEGWAAYLVRPFSLDPTDVCVRYLLLIDSAPEGARVYLNEALPVTYRAPHDDAPPFEVDVTDCVSLEDNTLAFRVECDAPGTFSGVALQAVPCE